MLEIYVSNNISIIMINDKHLEIFGNIYLRINSMLSWGEKDKCKLFLVISYSKRQYAPRVSRVVVSD